MKIRYLELPDGSKLISYHQHDYKYKEIDGEHFAIDSGQSNEIIRISNPDDKAILKQAELEEIFDFIRNDDSLVKPCFSKMSDEDLNDLFSCFEDKEYTGFKAILQNIFKLETSYRNGKTKEMVIE